MKKNILFLLLLALSIWACTKTEVTNDPALSGNWKVVSLDGTDVTKLGATMNINVPQKSVTGTSSCNQFNVDGPTIDTVAKTLTLPVIVTTKIACNDVIADFETNYYNAIRASTSYELDDKTLTLIEKSKKRLVFTK